MESWTKILCPKVALNLKVSLNGGQSFRWRETSDGEWTGVLGRNVWRLRWAPETEPSHLEFRVWGNGSTQTSELKEQISRYFRLETNLEPLYKQWAKSDSNFKKTICNAEFKGIRMLNQNPVENVFSFICSSNNNISRISSMVESLCLLFGEKLCNVDGKDYHGFPGVEALAQPEVEAKLRTAGFGYRAPFVQGTAKKILEQGGETWLQKLSSLEYPEAKRELMTLPGIGAKVADCICLMSLGHLQAVPVDTHVYQIAVARYTPHLAGRKSVTSKVYDEISGHFQQLYGPLAGWAHTVLFCADLKSFQDKRKKEESPSPAKKKKTK